MSDQTDARDRSAIGSICLLALVHLAARAAYLYFKPVDAVSFDAIAWQRVSHILAAGANPYQVDDRLNYPPLWMIVIYLMQRASVLSGLSFYNVLWLVLITFETAVLLATVALIRQFVSVGRARDVLLIGIALNPAAIFQVTQHGNFDVIIGLCVVMFVKYLIEFERRRDALDWLCACAWLGIATFAKSAPIVLLPLLAQHARSLPARGRTLGLFLLLAPAAIGVATIYVLSPVEVWQHVLLYHSFPFTFGITGLIAAATHSVHVAPLLWYPRIFAVALVAFMLIATIKIWRAEWRFAPRQLVLAAAVILVALPAFGPGFGTQYIYWFLPLLLVTFTIYGDAWRRLLIAGWIIFALTYCAQYLLMDTHGGALMRWFPESVTIGRISDTFSNIVGQTLLTLPMFVLLLVIVVAGIVMLRRSESTKAAGPKASA